MNAAKPLSPETSATRPLCPACGSPVVRIDTSVEVKYHVHYDVSFEDLEVISEQVGDGEWDDHTPALCGQCGWRGAVGQLRCLH